MLRIHVHGDATDSLDLLELTLRTRGTTEVVQFPNHSEHGRQSNFAHIEAETLVATEAKVNVLAQVAVQPDLLGIWECFRVMTASNLYPEFVRGEYTTKQDRN